LGVRTFGTPSRKYARGEKIIVVGSKLQEDYWICARDHVSGPHNKRSGNLDADIARSQDSDILTAGAVWAIAGCEWNTGDTRNSRVMKCRGAETHVGAESRSAEEPRFLWTRGRV